MAAVSDEMRAEFCRRGFVVVPGVLSSRQVSAARDTVAELLAGQPVPAGRAGYSLWPRFGAGGHPLLDFYRQAGVGELAGQLLRPGLGVADPDFAQVAITIPPFPHRPGVPHVDGLTPAEGISGPLARRGGRRSTTGSTRAATASAGRKP